LSPEVVRAPPSLHGYVGFGLADGVASATFRLASSEQILEATKRWTEGRGALPLRNYSGDVMNFDLAAELALAEGYRGLHRPGHDDVAPLLPLRRRAGEGGRIAFLYKVAGARAEEGDLSRNHHRHRTGGAGLRSMGCPIAVRVPAAAADFQPAVARWRSDGDPRRTWGAPWPLEPADEIADSSSTRSWATCPTRPAMSRRARERLAPLLERSFTSCTVPFTPPSRAGLSVRRTWWRVCHVAGNGGPPSRYCRWTTTCSGSSTLRANRLRGQMTVVAPSGWSVPSPRRFGP